MKVLVADDDEFSRRMMEMVLCHAGYEVVLACDGLEALASISSASPPQLMMFDWLMPGLNGIELCQRVRESARPDTYIMLVTGRARPEDIRAGREAGADDFITKPVDPKLLLEHVRKGEQALAERRGSSAL